MRQSIEVNPSLIRAHGPGWFLLDHDDIMQLKHDWSEAVKYDEISDWAKSAPAKLRWNVACRAALRLMPLAWLASDETLSGKNLATIDQVFGSLLSAQLDPQSRMTSEHLFQIFSNKNLPHELLRFCVAVEEAFDADKTGGLLPYVYGPINKCWAEDAQYTQKKHQLARMPEPEESNAFLAVCMDIHPVGSATENLWNHCPPTEAWLDGVSAMKEGPQTHSVKVYLETFANPVINELQVSKDALKTETPSQKPGLLSKLLSQFSSKE